MMPKTSSLALVIYLGLSLSWLGAQQLEKSPPPSGKIPDSLIPGIPERELFPPSQVDGKILPPLQGSVVKKITIEFEKYPNLINPERVRAYILQSLEKPYNQEHVDISIRELYQSGDYEFINSVRGILPDGNDELIIIVLPYHRISEINMEGASSKTRKKLLEKISSQVGQALNKATIKKDKRAIFDFLQEAGYTQCSVDDKVLLREDGKGIVTFKIEEGLKIHITDIRFEGNKSIGNGELADIIETRKYKPIISWLTDSGRLIEEQFRQDLENIANYYRNQGYLDVDVDFDKVDFLYPRKGSLKIIIHIEEGPLYRVGNIQFAGSTLFSQEELAKVIRLKSGEAFSPAYINAVAEGIRDLYGQRGYLTAAVSTQRAAQEDNSIDLVFDILEGRQYKLRKISVSGNTLTKTKVILRELALIPGENFSSTAIRSSQNRLLNTRFFDYAILVPATTDVPGYRDLNITVKEARTGNINVGATADSVQSFVGFVELSESNFDLGGLLKPGRKHIKGSGQKLRLRFSSGADVTSFNLYFEEPWLFDKRLAVGFSYRIEDSSYESSAYQRSSQTYRPFIRKRLIGLLEGTFSYTYDVEKIYDVAEDHQDSIEAKEDIISKMSILLSRDTRDNFFLPRQGTKFIYTLERGGDFFGGDVDFISHQFRFSQYIPLDRRKKHVIYYQGWLGTLVPQGGKTQLPFSERFFLGGGNTLRGFEYREVGPKDSLGEPLGGNSVFMVQCEYLNYFSRQMGLRIFYDGGFLNAEREDWSTDNYNDNYGVGLIITVGGWPLNLNFGWPRKTDKFNDRGMQFNFSFGAAF